MKILHLCLANFFIDNYSYQENILPKYHKKMGLEVEIIASLLSFDDNGKACLLKKGDYYFNEYDIPVKRLEYKDSIFGKRFRQYKGTYEAIKKVKPDIAFIHGCQFLDINIVAKYVKYHPNVKVYVDNHADFSNSARNFVSKNILHKIIWRYCAHRIEPYATKFYGVLPARVDFLKTMYKLPPEKVELLVMGADDELIDSAKEEGVRESIRDNYNIEDDDFLVMTGGKFDHAKKQTLLLMEAVKQLEFEKIKLIVFGSVVNELKEKFNSLCDESKVQYIGWIAADEAYRYFNAADLVVFPGRHSVFWEQVAGLGIPMIVKYWKGTDHVDLGGNCKFLYHDSVEEIKEKILEVYNNPNEYQEMVRVAKEKGADFFSYRSIASRCIEL